MYKNRIDKLSEKAPSEILKLVINSMTYSVFFKGLDGKYLGCNLEYEKLIGKNEAEIIGKTAYDLNVVESADEFTSSDLDVINTGQPIKIEI
jgi:PAS domain-containing protein